jgi:hypothetical protein
MTIRCNRDADQEKHLPRVAALVPKRYIRMMMTRETLQHREKVQAAKSRQDRRELEESHDWDMQSWKNWLTSIEDHELVTRAERMDLSLDDIPVAAASDPGERPGHGRVPGEPEIDVIHPQTRRSLQKAIRERAPAYRKVRREIADFYLKLILGIDGVISKHPAEAAD